jgi:hypothetical protein
MSRKRDDRCRCVVTRLAHLGSKEERVHPANRIRQRCRFKAGPNHLRYCGLHWERHLATAGSVRVDARKLSRR